jgi:8-oxo-dGTP diphosphatase
LVDHDRDAFYLGLPKRRAGSGALFVDERGRALIVEPFYKPTWEIPGGVVEAGEDPRAACRRECMEELGLDPRLGRLLVIEHKIEALPHGDSIMFIYDGGFLADASAVQLRKDELHSYRFAQPEDLAQLMSPGLANRLCHALRAKYEGMTIELVNGTVV